MEMDLSEKGRLFLTERVEFLEGKDNGFGVFGGFGREKIRGNGGVLKENIG